jgi:aldose 1-epimerase
MIICKRMIIRERTDQKSVATSGAREGQMQATTDQPRVYALKADHTPAGSLHCAIYPHQGGRIGSFWIETSDGARIDALMPMDGATFDPLVWPKAGIYPLAPWSNLIRASRFTHDGQEVALIPHPLVTPHALHGFTQMRAWQVESHSASALTMVYHHDASERDGWPWSFTVRQQVSLDQTGLQISMRLTNRSSGTMPAGLGFHPYFKLALGDAVMFTAGSQWQSTGDGFVSHKQSLPGEQGRHQLRHGVETMTLHYADYAGDFVIARADGVRIRMQSSGPLDHFVYHVPQGGAYVCAEPVSHVVDAFNLAPQGVEETGFHLLKPHESFTGQISITIESA